MIVEKKEIIITIKNGGEKYVVKTYPNEYRNLMALLNNSIYLENFGACGGQCRCATCIVKVPGLMGNANTMEINEKVIINKAGLNDSDFRLSCQLLITDYLHEAVIEIYEEGC